MSIGSSFLLVGVIDQSLWLIHDGVIQFECPISTAKNGLGEWNGSYQTPRGWHRVVTKIGAHAHPLTQFIARVPVGRVDAKAWGDNLILSRIVWLSGAEIGRNQGGKVDTQSRMIYIHGAPDAKVDGQMHSKGCICLRTSDMIDLYDHVYEGLMVYIHPGNARSWLPSRSCT